MTLRVLSLDAAFAECRAPWEEIIKNSGLCPTLHPDWMSASAQSVGRNQALQVLVKCQDDAPVNALIPFYLSKLRMFGVPMRCLNIGSNLMSYHAEIISSIQPETALRTLLGNVGDHHVMCMANIPLGGPTDGAIRKIAATTGRPLVSLDGSRSPYLPILGAWQDFLDSNSSNFRYQLRRRKKSLEKFADRRLVWFDSPGSVEVLLRDMLEIEARSWKADQGIAITQSASERRYYESLLPFLARQGYLIANVIYAADRPVAYNLCCNWNGWFGQLKTSFDKDYRDFSAGTLAMDAVVERAFTSQAREFDFLGGADPHKLAWTSAIREHVTHFLFNRQLRSRFIGGIKRLRQRLR